MSDAGSLGGGAGGAPPVSYAIVVRTADEEGAGVDRSVYLKIHGEQGSLKPVELGTGGVAIPAGRRGPFSRNSTSHFAVTRASVGDLTHVEVWHDAANAWGLVSVEVRVGDSQWTFSARARVPGQTQLDKEGRGARGQSTRLRGEFARVSTGATRFHLAARFGRTEELEGMLARGDFEVDAPDKLGRTAAHYAALYGAQPALELLAEAGARFLRRDNDGRHCLHHACANLVDTADVVRLVLRVAGPEARERGDAAAPIDTDEDEARVLCSDKDAFGKTPAHFAAAAGHVDVLQLLESRAGGQTATVDTGDGNDVTPLLLAAMHGQASALLCLIDLGAGLSHADALGMNLLHHAAGRGQAALLREVLERDLAPRHRQALAEAVNQADSAGQTPILVAAQHGRLGTAKVLYEHGGNMYARDKDNNTFLHLAAVSGAAELLAYGAAKLKVNEENLFGFTPLHVAIEKDNEAAVAWLVRNDANVHKKLLSGETPIEFARQRGVEGIVYAIEEALSRQIVVPPGSDTAGPTRRSSRFYGGAAGNEPPKNAAVAAAAAAAASAALEASGMLAGELEDEEAGGAGPSARAGSSVFSHATAKSRAVEEAARPLRERSPEEVARDEANRIVSAENDNLRRLAEHLEAALREKSQEIARLQKEEAARASAFV